MTPLPATDATTDDRVRWLIREVASLLDETAEDVIAACERVAEAMEADHA